MLEDLDKVEWSKLGHGYGVATDVPALLRALASPDPEVRDAAWHDLHGNLWHQETVYEATVHAVPFLVQLACRPEVPERHRIVAYIGLIARGNSFPAVRQAVRQGTSHYALLLDDAEPRVRATAAYLLAVLHEDAETHLGWISARLAAGEPDDMIRATLVFCLGHLAAAARHGETASLLEQLVTTDPAPVVRITAALGLAWCQGAAISPRALTVLVDGADETHGAETIFHHVLCEDENFWTWYGQALCRCGSHDRTIPAILAAMDKSDYPEQIAEDLLIALLDDRPLAPGTHISELGPPLRLALAGIGSCEGLWIGTHGGITMLRNFGLPGRRQEFQMFLAGV